jgi:hypothetical protein
VKRILTISLLFVYVAITSGLVVEMHYCMGKWVNGSVSLVRHHNDKHTCGKCGMAVAGDSKCCHDEVAIFRVNDCHQPISYYFEIKPDIIAIPDFFAYQHELFTYNSTGVFISSSPPGIQDVSFQELYGVYRV